MLQMKILGVCNRKFCIIYVRRSLKGLLVGRDEWDLNDWWPYMPPFGWEPCLHLFGSQGRHLTNHGLGGEEIFLTYVWMSGTLLRFRTPAWPTPLCCAAKRVLMEKDKIWMSSQWLTGGFEILALQKRGVGLRGCSHITSATGWGGGYNFVSQMGWSPWGLLGVLSPPFLYFRLENAKE